MSFSAQAQSIRVRLYNIGVPIAFVKTAPYGLPANTRLGTQEWLAAALEELATGGIDAVRIERLAAQLKVTKGSFNGLRLAAVANTGHLHDPAG